MIESTPYYFFEFDRPGKKPGRTRWRMTIAEAAARHPGYRPIVGTEEFRSDVNLESFQPYKAGKGPIHKGVKSD